MVQQTKQSTNHFNYKLFNLDANDSEVCYRIWNPKKCSSTITRYSFSPATKCKAMEFGGCLGNNNNFATPQECSNACVTGTFAQKYSSFRNDK